jgi:DNA-binding response OmpR family regulator
VLNTLGYHIRRRQGPPVVALYRGGPEERVAALAAGADEAIGFPVHLGVIQARILAQQRLTDAVRLHASGHPATPAPADVIAVGPLRLDRTARRFAIRGEEVTLTPREFALLDYLLAHAGSVRTRDEILDAVWGVSFDTGTNMVDVYVYFLRRKLEAFGVRGLIETVRGRGYRLVRPEEAPAEVPGA